MGEAWRERIAGETSEKRWLRPVIPFPSRTSSAHSTTILLRPSDAVRASPVRISRNSPFDLGSVSRRCTTTGKAGGARKVTYGTGDDTSRAGGPRPRESGQVVSESLLRCRRRERERDEQRRK